MKRICSLILLVLLLGLTACSQAPAGEVEANEEVVVSKDAGTEVASEVTETPETEKSDKNMSQVPKLDNLKVIMPYGTPTLTMVKMITENPVIEEGLEVDYEMLQATDVLSSMLINKEADIAIVPTNLAAVLHSKGLGYKVAGSSVWGILYVASSEEIDSVEDLKGKEISLIGRGLTPDAILRYVLAGNNIDPDTEVTLNYFSGSSELAANYISGESNIGMVPQPLLTNVLMKRDDSKVVIDLQEEWTKLTGLDKYPQASIIVSEKLAEEHPQIVEKFLAEYAQAITWLNENPAQAGNYYEGLGIGLKAKIVEKAIPSSNIRFETSEDAREALDAYLNVLFEFNPKLLGGQPADETLYLK